MIENITRIRELAPLFEEILQAILSEEYLEFLALGLNFEKNLKSEKIIKLENMSMVDFSELKAKNPERNLRISNVIDENNCEIEELVEEIIEKNRDEFSAEKIVEFLQKFVASTIDNGMHLKNQEKLKNDLQNIL